MYVEDVHFTLSLSLTLFLSLSRIVCVFRALTMESVILIDCGKRYIICLAYFFITFSMRMIHYLAKHKNKNYLKIS